MRLDKNEDGKDTARSQESNNRLARPEDADIDSVRNTRNKQSNNPIITNAIGNYG
jgi:hypothetical protein